MFDFIKTFFYSSRNERAGFKIIIAMLVLFALINFYLKFSATNSINIKVLSPDDIAYIDSSSNHNSYKSDIQPSENQLFEFNPNTVSKAELISLGVSERTANIFEKLRNKGFKFYKKEDIKKVYGFTEADYKRLETYMILDEKTTYKNKFDFQSKDNISNPTFSNFDPNTASDIDFKTMGINEKAITTIRNYQAKGGVFYNNEKFLSNYSIPQILKDSLAKYITIKKENIPKKNDTSSIRTVAKIEIKIDLNKATVEELDKVKWMSMSSAARIIKYRDALGGFHNLGQLKEVWGIHDTFLVKIQNYLYLSIVNPKIRINECELDSIPRHPYIDKYRFKSVILYRKNHGKYNGPTDLLKTKIYTQEEIDKMSPYLKF